MSDAAHAAIFFTREQSDAIAGAVGMYEFHADQADEIAAGKLLEDERRDYILRAERWRGKAKVLRAMIGI